VPAAVGALVYAALRPLGRKRREFRTVAALAVGTGWLFLLGFSSGPLSPCRLADGRPGGRADTFTRALLTGDLARAHRYETHDLFQLDMLAPKPVSSGQAEAAIGRRTSGRLLGMRCHHCYRYRTPARPGRDAGTLSVAVGCDGRDWRVRSWFTF
jgi:hypothetical protein